MFYRIALLSRISIHQIKFLMADFTVDPGTDFNQSLLNNFRQEKCEWSAVTSPLCVHFVAFLQRMHNIKFLEGFICIPGFFGIHSISNWHRRLCSKSRTSEVSGDVLFVVLQWRHSVIIWRNDSRGVEDPCEVLLESLAAAQPKCPTEQEVSDC
jgi:hypothetical protein